MKELGATAKQLAFIRALVKEIGWNEEQYRKYLQQHFLKESSKELTKEEASYLIQTLKFLKENDFESPELPDMEFEI